MAKIRLSSLLGDFLFATGTPPSVWRVGPVPDGRVAQSKVRIEDMKLKPDIEYLGLPVLVRSEAGNHGE